MTLRLTFGRNNEVGVELAADEEERLRTVLNARFAARPKPTPQLSPVAQAAMAVEAARKEGRQ